VAADVATVGGFSTKEAFAKWLADNTGTPGWLYWSQNANALKQAKDGVEPYAGWYKQGQGAVVPSSRYKRDGGGVARNSSFIASQNSNELSNSLNIVVTGGGTNTFWSGGDFGYAGSASVDLWR
jgi:hypothetical protein